MSTSTLTFDIVPSSTQHPLGIEVWVNNQKLFDQAQVTDACGITHQVDDSVESTHVVKIVLKNKTAEHTQVNDRQEIVSDSTVDVINFKLDDIDIDQVVRECAVYTHNFNSSDAHSDHKFYNTIGCNGVVKFEFSTPAYLWLLEHM